MSHLIKIIVAPCTFLAASFASAESGFWSLIMPRGVTEVSNAVYDVHMLMMYICIAIGVVVFGFMFYVMFAHRNLAEQKPQTFMKILQSK